MKDNQAQQHVQMKLHFEVHASLLQQLGEQLITDDIAAVAELVKNSYDADASFVEINVDPSWTSYDENGKILEGKIEINDNGFGMNLRNIKNGWLTISRSEKRHMKEKGTVTDRFKRLPLGDKGLGRLSAQRLGKHLCLITKEKGSKLEIKVDIDWSKFKGDLTLSDINIPVVSRQVTQELENKSYTHLIITGLANPKNWLTQENVNHFERSLSRIRSPFDFNRTFFIKAKIGSRQLELPEVSKELLDLAPVVYHFVVDKQFLYVTGKYRAEFFPGFMSFGDRLGEFAQTIKRELPKYNTNYMETGTIVFNYEEKIDLVSLGEYAVNFHPGNFEGYIYDYPLDQATFEVMSDAGGFKQFDKVSDFRRHVKQNKGIKIFRDQFRILPYGEEGLASDWMGLGESFTGGTSYYFLKPANVVGYINLTGIENKNLKEKTDREGFIDNPYSKAFFNICKHIVKRINLNREFLRRKYKAYTKSIDEKQEARANHIPSYTVAKEEVKRVTDFAEKIAHKTEQSIQAVNHIKHVVSDSKEKIKRFNINNKEKEQINNLLKTFEKCSVELEGYWRDILQNVQEIYKARAGAVALVSQIEATMAQVQEVMELAGLGLTAETLTHELFTIIDNTKNDVEELRKYLKGHYDKDVKVEAYLDGISARSDALRKQVTHLSPGFKNVRSKKQKLRMKDIVAEHIDYYTNRANRLGIELCNFKGNDDFTILANKGMIIQVFDNLYLNSEFWLEHANKNNMIREKKYYVEIFAPGIVHIWDTGLGIDGNMEDRIFEPFISSKPEGRGLGLYIITRILGYHECSIRLMEPKNNFGNRYKFALDFSRIVVEG